MFRRNYFQWLLQIIAVTRHVTSVMPMISAKFELVSSPEGAGWCSVDLPSMVLQMMSEDGDTARTCAMECLKDGCCLLYQFKKNSFLCELFEYTTTNFSVIPGCTSLRITMRNAQPVIQRNRSTIENPYSNVDRSIGQCIITARLFFIEATNRRGSFIDIGGMNGAPGDPLSLKTKQSGKLSQQWYFDTQGYFRSTKNNYGIDIVNKSCGGGYSQLGVKPFNVSSQQWKYVGRMMANNIGSACIDYCTDLVLNWCNSGNPNQLWDLLFN